MNEVIASILEAEKKADEIIKNSLNKSKKIREDADIQGEKIKNGAVAVFKLRRASVIREAEKKADAVYEETVREGEKAAVAAAHAAEAGADALSEQIVKDILG